MHTAQRPAQTQCVMLSHSSHPVGAESVLNMCTLCLTSANSRIKLQFYKRGRETCMPEHTQSSFGLITSHDLTKGLMSNLFSTCLYKCMIHTCIYHNPAAGISHICSQLYFPSSRCQAGISSCFQSFCLSCLFLSPLFSFCCAPSCSFLVLLVYRHRHFFKLFKSLLKPPRRGQPQHCPCKKMNLFRNREQDDN